MSTSTQTQTNRLLAAPTKLLERYLEEAAVKLDDRRKDVGAQIRAARIAKGWHRQKDLARRVKVEPQTVSNWERGVTTPDMDTLEVIARETGKDLSFFVRDPTTQAAEAASIAEVVDMVRQLLVEVGRLQVGQDGIDERLARLEVIAGEETG